MEILHSLVNWDLESLNAISKASKTLILGSFNPNNPNPNQNTDFYYGRNTNHFWKSIARNLNLPENHFFNNLQNKKDYMAKYKFFFFDLIKSIDLECNNIDVLNRFVDQHIFTNYSDNVLFKVYPYNFEDHLICKKIYFNNQIIEFLEQNQIAKVIHTLGNSRINTNLVAKPLSLNLGFNPFVNQIVNTSLILFAVSLIISLLNDKKAALKGKLLYGAIIPSILAGIIGIWKIIEFNSKTSDFGDNPFAQAFGAAVSIEFGLYLVVLAGTLLPILAFVVKDKSI